jgi:hypothetical protein
MLLMRRILTDLSTSPAFTRRQGKRVLLCYEEAIGFSCGEDSFDKAG